MSTVSLTAVTPAYPFITDRIKGSVYAASDVARTTPIQSQIDSTVNHPTKIWRFTGLEENDYIFSIDIIDEDGMLLDNITVLDVTPSDLDNSIGASRADITRLENMISADFAGTVDTLSYNPGAQTENVWFRANSGVGVYTHFLSAASTPISVSDEDGVVDFMYNKITGFYKKANVSVDSIILSKIKSGNDTLTSGFDLSGGLNLSAQDSVGYINFESAVTVDKSVLQTVTFTTFNSSNAYILVMRRIALSNNWREEYRILVNPSGYGKHTFDVSASNVLLLLGDVIGITGGQTNTTQAFGFDNTNSSYNGKAYRQVYYNSSTSKYEFTDVSFPRVGGSPNNALYDISYTYKSLVVYINEKMEAAQEQIAGLRSLVVNAEDFGCSPFATAEENSIGLQNALLGGYRTVRLTRVGQYLFDRNVYIDDYTNIQLGKEVYLKKAGPYQFILVNRGALTRTWNYGITLNGAHIICNGFNIGVYDSSVGYNSPTFGLLGAISFFYVKDLEVNDFECLDTSSDEQYNFHVCTFERIKLTNFKTFGEKDGIHLGRGKHFIINNVYGLTRDDLIGINASDYIAAQPELGDITDGFISNVFDYSGNAISGALCRFLIGAWADWHSGIVVQHGDPVRHNGKLYRAMMPTSEMFDVGYTAPTYTSTTAPTHTSGSAVLNGITWIFTQDDAGLSAEVKRVYFSNIYTEKNRSFYFHHDNLPYNRSIHPDATYLPIVEDIRINGVVDDTVNCNAPILNIECQAKVSLSGVKPKRSIARLANIDQKWLTLSDIDLTASLDTLNPDILCSPEVNVNIEANGFMQDRNFDIKIKNSSNVIVSSDSGSAVRLNGNISLVSVSNLKPRIGDMVKEVGVPKVWTGSIWKSLLT